jgi:hypothetical protein
MKKPLVLVFALMVSAFLVSCSEGSSATDAKGESPASESTTAPAEAEATSATGQEIIDMAYTKIKKGLDDRSITLSADQEAALKQLINESGVTKENFKAKRKEVISKLRSDILTEDQRTKIGR